MATSIIIVPDVAWFTATPQLAKVPTLPSTLAAMKPPTTGIIVWPDFSL
jgi:hypothetical protein